jgi:hypothetical protein
LAERIVRTSNLQFFLNRAEQARAEAEAATLDLVRERCRRSQAAWSALADKAQRSERLRTQDQERKVARAAPITDENYTEEEEDEGHSPAPEGRTKAL